MTGRRVLVTAGVALLGVIIILVVFVTGNLAQGPAAPTTPSTAAGAGGAGGGMAKGGMAKGGMAGGPGGGMPGMAGGGGMVGRAGGGGGGGALAWQETTPPEHLQMTYDEFLAKTGLPKVPLPKAYTVDEQGQPTKLTRSEWVQNYRIYREGAVVEKAVERGMGGPLADKARSELDHIDREHKAMRDLYKYAIEHCFAADIGYPIMGPVRGSNPSTVEIRIDVLFRCTTKTFPDLVVKKLQPLSVPGWPWREGSSPGRRIGAAAGRARFDVITRGGGYYKPVKLYLDAEAIGSWMRFWSGTQVRLNLMDTTGKVMAAQTMSVGLNGGSICQQMIFPPYFRPHREINALPDVSPYGTKQPMFNGAKRDMYTMKGWRLAGGDGLRFSLPIAELATLNGAEVELLPAPDSGAAPLRIGHVGTENASRQRKK